MKLRKTRDWFDSHMGLLAYPACKMAILANPLHDMLTSFRHSPDYALQQEKDPTRWYRFYRGYKNNINAVGEVYGRWNRKWDLKAFLDSVAHQTPSDLKERMMTHCATEEDLRTFFRPFAKWALENLEHDAELISASKYGLEDLYLNLVDGQMRYAPELSFILGVVVPFWFHHGELVFPVYRRARKGELQAIENVLRLDKTALHDPRIASHWERACRNPEGVFFNRMVNAIRYDPSKKLSRQRVKIMLGGLVHALFDVVSLYYDPHVKISKPELRELFDSVSEDLYGSRIDEDLYLMSDDNFRMQINKADKFWRVLFSGVSKQMDMLGQMKTLIPPAPK